MLTPSLENDSPSRGRKLSLRLLHFTFQSESLENDSPSRGRKQLQGKVADRVGNTGLENDSPSRGRKLDWGCDFTPPFLTFRK